MRSLFCALAVAAALCAAPASAQQQQPQQAAPVLTAEQEQLLETYLGPAFDLAIQLCLTESAPNLPNLEAQWVAAGWPEFGEMHSWRVSNIPPGDRVLLSFGMLVEPVTDSSVAGNSITCSLLMPPIMRPLLDRHIEARFRTGDGMGFFLLQSGQLTERSIDSLRGTNIGALFAETPPNQRIVMLTTEAEGATVVARITVMHRAQ